MNEQNNPVIDWRRVCFRHGLSVRELDTLHIEPRKHRGEEMSFKRLRVEVPKMSVGITTIFNSTVGAIDCRLYSVGQRIPEGRLFYAEFVFADGRFGPAVAGYGILSDDGSGELRVLEGLAAAYPEWLDRP